jgi:3-hydroxybutyryl-CoA dehydratase
MNDLEPGQQHELRVAIAERDIERFAELSGDRSRIHMDATFARSHGFDGRVVHGAFLASLVSRMVGTEFPGDRAVLERMDLAFRQPCFAPCELVIRAVVRQVSEAVSSVVLDVSIAENDGRVLVTGKTWHRIFHE